MKKFQFSIRDVMWMTLLVMMLVGWWLDRYQLTTEAIVLQGKVRNLETEVANFRQFGGVFLEWGKLPIITDGVPVTKQRVDE